MANINVQVIGGSASQDLPGMMGGPAIGENGLGLMEPGMLFYHDGVTGRVRPVKTMGIWQYLYASYNDEEQLFRVYSSSIPIKSVARDAGAGTITIVFDWIPPLRHFVNAGQSILDPNPGVGRCFVVDRYAHHYDTEASRWYRVEFGLTVDSGDGYRLKLLLTFMRIDTEAADFPFNVMQTNCFMGVSQAFQLGDAAPPGSTGGNSSNGQVQYAL